MDPIVFKISPAEILKKRFLIVPSMAAGLFNGLNNFLLGLNSDLGSKGALIFAIGALLTGMIYQAFCAF